MKRITLLSRIAAVSLLFGALAAGIAAFTLTKSAIGLPDNPIIPAPLGVIETDGTLDTTFNVGTFTNGLVLASTYQSDGKLLIAGQFTRVHGAFRAGIARLNTDGTLDTSFDPGTGSDLGVGGVLVQPDGNILIWKFFHIFNGDNGLASLVRLKSDGSTDSTFNVGHNLGGITGFNITEVFSVILQADGKIVVAGQFSFVITPTGNVNRSRVARFNSDGTFDPTFDPGAGAFSSLGEESTFVFNAARQSIGPNAGKIIIQGSFDLFDNNPALGMARLNTNGSFDSTFNAGTASGGFQSVFGILVQPDDRPVVFGVFDSFNGTMCSDIVRLNSDGSVDGGFSTEAFKWYGNTAIIFGAALQADGKILVGGDFHSLGAVTTNNVVRLNTDGTQDATFSATGGGPSADNVSTVAIRLSDGKIFFGGNFSTFGGEVRNNVALANTDGTVDSTFAGLGGATDYNPNIWTMVVQPDGKILMTGYFNSVNGMPHYNVLRVNPNGTVDLSFQVDTNGSTRGLLLQPDGKVVIAGNFGEVNGVPRSRIARVNADGTLDLTFNPGTGADRIVRALVQDSAGNIYAGGDFTMVNGISRRGIVKLTPTGAVDPAFNSAGGGVSSFVNAITPPDSAGHIVIGGSFSTYNGTSARRIVRIDTTTGAIDPTFQAGIGTGFGGTVYALQAAPDGKYYAGGNFGTFNGVTRRLIARLNNDGTLDFGFADSGLEGITYSLALQNGKVYAGGDNFFAVRQSIMVRLTSSGALDSSFDTGKGFDVLPQYSYGQFIVNTTAMAIQADGKLLVGGIFNQYNGTARSCLARLTGPLPSPTPTPSATPTTTLGNISARLKVETGDDVLIGGFIVTGTQPKKVIVRAIGPSVPVAGALADPILELRDSSGALIRSNDNWRSQQEAEIIATTIPPSNNLESAIVETLPANGSAYTAIVRGVNGGTGVGLVEVYDLNRTVDSKLANLSARGLVRVGDDVMIAGTIVLGQASQRVLVRALGPSLPVAGKLADPTLELRDGNGALIRANDNWRSDQEAEIIATTIPPTNNLESAIVETLPANGAAYTAIVRGANNTSGVALVEVYGLH
jgi:uncharacterized delta-60 repeat protein